MKSFLLHYVCTECLLKWWFGGVYSAAWYQFLTSSVNSLTLRQFTMHTDIDIPTTFLCYICTITVKITYSQLYSKFTWCHSGIYIHLHSLQSLCAVSQSWAPTDVKLSAGWNIFLPFPWCWSLPKENLSQTRFCCGNIRISYLHKAK